MKDGIYFQENLFNEIFSPGNIQDLFRTGWKLLNVESLVTQDVNHKNEIATQGQTVIAIVEMTPNGTTVTKDGFNVDVLKQYRIFESKIENYMCERTKEKFLIVNDSEDNEGKGFSYFLKRYPSCRDEPFVLAIKDEQGEYVINGLTFKTVKEVENYYIIGARKDLMEKEYKINALRKR